MPTGDIYDKGSITTTNAGDYPYYYEYTTPDYEMPQTVSIPSVWTEPIIYPTPYMGSYQEPNIKSTKKGGDDDMRYLYEVILVNPKNDTFKVDKVVAKSETSAILKAYEYSDFADSGLRVEFDDLKTSCRVLMEWKKEKSLKKAIETIKEAVE